MEAKNKDGALNLDREKKREQSYHPSQACMLINYHVSSVN